MHNLCLGTPWTYHHHNSLIALFLTTNQQRLVLWEEIIATINIDTESKLSIWLLELGNIKVDDRISKSGGKIGIIT